MQTNIIRSLILCAVGAVTVGACDEDVTPGVDSAVIEGNDESQDLPAELGLGDGWVAVEPGLWSRFDEQGEPTFLGIGEAGKAHAIASLVGVEGEIMARLAEQDTADAQEKLAEIRGFITEVQTDSPDQSEAAPTLRCSPNVQAYVDAYPVACGAAALASASFSICGTTKGTVKTYANAACGYQSTTHQCGPYSANPASCASSTSITGAGTCSSYSFAQISAPNVYLYIWDQNNLRGSCGGSGTSSGGVSTGITTGTCGSGACQTV